MFLVILAAGNGIRLKSKIPKPYISINEISLLEYSLRCFKKCPEIKKTIVVYNKNHKKYFDQLNLKNVIKVVGGNSRQKSTFNALKKIKHLKCKKVLIHDCARPNTSSFLIKKIIKKLKKCDAVIPLRKIKDAAKLVNKNSISKNLNKNNIKLAQTPQGFSFNKIYKKHKKNVNKNFDDDSSLFIKDNEKVSFVNGDEENLKITTKNDFEYFKSLKKSKIFYGIGFDIHRFKKGKNIYLGGVKIPFNSSLEGHSDADPVLHALIDSLLGATGLGDIGMHFSDKSKKNKNIRSTKLLKKIIKTIKLKKVSINNIDINIILQKPKIKNYRNRMIKVISRICKVNFNQVNIKGKTTEKLGIIGKERAVAAEVITSVTKYV
jgi:2-C-methyl-D-erythritol 4-phosphate cytidylyltransferase/2-C-methyl-D-erythritol 2,4-cyclodiphosphate synthase